MLFIDREKIILFIFIKIKKENRIQFYIILFCTYDLEKLENFWNVLRKKNSFFSFLLFFSLFFLMTLQGAS